jgi:hypothetical protein
VCSSDLKFEGAKPLQSPSSPSPMKERGIKGVRLESLISIWLSCFHS